MKSLQVVVKVNTKAEEKTLPAMTPGDLHTIKEAKAAKVERQVVNRYDAAHVDE